MLEVGARNEKYWIRGEGRRGYIGYNEEAGEGIESLNSLSPARTDRWTGRVRRMAGGLEPAGMGDSVQVVDHGGSRNGWLVS